MYSFDFFYTYFSHLFIVSTMKLSYCLLFVFSFISVGLFAQDNTEFNPYLLPDYEVLSATKGDINADGMPDAVLILKHSTEETSLKPTLRPVLILIGQKNKKYVVALRQDKIILCLKCNIAANPKEPLAKVEYNETKIEKGQFSFNFYGGKKAKWSRIIIFKYDAVASKTNKKDTWFLHTDTMERMEQLPNLDFTTKTLVKGPPKAGVVKSDFKDYDAKIPWFIKK